MKLSIIIPVYNAERTLPHLLDSLSAQKVQDIEVIFVDDNSGDSTTRILDASPYKIIKLPENHGPAYCRNIGAENADGDVLVFTDSDCRVHESWSENIYHHFVESESDAIMGKLVLMPSTFLGDAISALGFPAGGAIGFDKIWKVDENGYTTSLSTCNCAVRKDVFRKIGGFDTSFPFPGGEDSLLAYHLIRSGYRIQYSPDVVVHHEARDAFMGFIRWQFKRGISSYIFSKKISNKGDFMSLRLWSTKNIIREYYMNRKFPLIFFLLATSFIVQFSGLIYAKLSRSYNL